ncbi:MAG: hypothetical protein AAF849_22000 [Bacteroidota bacterium]
MSTQIIDTVKTLSLFDKVTLMELLIKDIKEETSKRTEQAIRMEQAAELLLVDYQTDEELTAFTSLDQENFYEAR